MREGSIPSGGPVIMDEERPEHKKYTMITPPSAEGKGLSPTEKSMNENEEITTAKKSSAPIVVGALLVVVLIVAGLFLPPISLGQRLGLAAATQRRKRQRLLPSNPPSPAPSAYRLPKPASAKWTWSRCPGRAAGRHSPPRQRLRHQLRRRCADWQRRP